MASLDAAAVPTKQRPVAMWAAHCHTTRRLCSRVHKFGAASQACRFTSPRQPRGDSFKKPPTNQRGIFYRKTTNQPRGASFEEKPQTNQGGHRLKKKQTNQGGHLFQKTPTTWISEHQQNQPPTAGRVFQKRHKVPPLVEATCFDTPPWSYHSVSR